MGGTSTYTLTTQNQFLTCTVDSISLKAYIAGTLKTTKGVIAGSIFMTVVHPSCTLINIYTN